MDIGEHLKERRSALDLSQSGLAERSGVSASMICDIEGGRKNPTLKVVSQLAYGLQCTISELLGLPVSAPRVTLHRASERQVMRDMDSGLERSLLSPAMVQRGIQIVQYRLPAGATGGDFPPERPGVVEHITVLSGRLEVAIGDETVRLAEGDSVTFTADVTHSFTNPGDEETLALLVSDLTQAGHTAFTPLA